MISYTGFDNLPQDHREKIANCVNTIVAYLQEKSSLDESIKETVNSLCEGLDLDKTSASRLKKSVKAAANAIAKDKVRDLTENNEAVDSILRNLGQI